MLSAGATAPEFTLADLAGGQHSLHSLLERGPVLLALYKISCPVCQMSMPYLQRLAIGTIPIVGISQDDDRATRRFTQTLGLTMVTLLDREEDGYPVSNAFGITHVPSLFLVEPGGMISLAVTGFDKRGMEAIGKRANVVPFLSQDNVPEWKAG